MTSRGRKAQCRGKPSPTCKADRELQCPGLIASNMHAMKRKQIRFGNTGRGLLKTLNFYSPPGYTPAGDELPAAKPGQA